MTEPRYVGRSAASDLLAARWDELAATVDGTEPFFDRTFRSRIFRSDDESLSLMWLDDDFHEMRIALRVAQDGTILEAAGRMNRHPYDICPRAVESLAVHGRFRDLPGRMHAYRGPSTSAGLAATLKRNASPDEPR